MWIDTDLTGSRTLNVIVWGWILITAATLIGVMTVMLGELMRCM